MSTADDLVDFFSDPDPLHMSKGLVLKNDLKCMHDIIAEWCATCKHLDTPSIKQVLLEENLAIMENLLSWPSKNGNRTT